VTRRLTIDESAEDAAFLKAYADDVEMLCGLMIETFEDKPVNLLSPFFRRLFLEHAKSVQWRHQKLANRLHVDNPGKSLDPSAATNIEAMVTPMTDLKRAASALAAKYQDDRRVTSIVCRASSIAVFVDHTRRPAIELPSSWMGWPVEVVDSGPMATMGGDPQCP
jgi:hypothetical protein